MGRSYRQCSVCGKRALSIATRCPGCGRELSEPVTTDPRPRLELGRVASPRLVAGALGVAAVVAAGFLGRGSLVSEQRHPLASVSDGSSAEVAFRDPATELDSASAAATPAEAPSRILVARTWTHVRKTRRVGGEVEAVLLPGDSVVADSLSRGWYRVALEGEVLGYAHRSTLAAPGSR